MSDNCHVVYDLREVGGIPTIIGISAKESPLQRSKYGGEWKLTRPLFMLVRKRNFPLPLPRRRRAAE